MRALMRAENQNLKKVGYDPMNRNQALNTILANDGGWDEFRDNEQAVDLAMDYLLNDRI